ncbi:penicillin-binding protein 1A [Humidesulfovibrio mexicanus]|uniref:Penicillin-binding protein 1A n=1 Tax=Humidesulfovibrio mexicanus TaxID=147047 RepID=A0A238Y1L7_9BACT|nr:PBP1A family penicillin-binding protein [Humidesulfovibrio mexicanus]SNR65017.1 penicillin-binding protein 1A [Humidesulfovibrio mexicanus]
MRWSRSFKRKLFLAILALPVAAALCAALAFWYYSHDLPGFRNITDYKPPLVTTVLSREGRVLGYFYKEKRFLVRLQDMPEHLPLAFLAAEDSSFYKHDGIDPWAIFRASLMNLKAGGIRQGGSTITQQVVKRLLLSPEKSFERKIKEAILAYRLENYLTKDEILTIYLNQIYLGSKAYGVEAASREYFGKHVKDLTLAEAAVLAGLPQAPSRYNPYSDPEAAKVRQKYVLDQMLSQGWITREQHTDALAQKLAYKSMEDNSWKLGAYYLEEVRRFLIEKYGEEEVYTGGLTVETACVIAHQQAADNAMRRGLGDVAKRKGWEGPAGRLKPQEVQGFLDEGRTDESIKPGTWVRAVVTESAKDKAVVRFGQNTGEIPASTTMWCRNGVKGLKGEAAPIPGDPSRIVHKGDVVWATVREAKGGRHYVLNLERAPGPEGALVSMLPETGEVVALVGGFSFEKSQFNRATQAKRQPGSSFKPIVYSAALDNGLTPASVIMDAPIVFANAEAGTVWRPENYENIFYGPTLLSTALAKSRNLVTIRVAQKIGVRTVIERARALGIESELPENLSIALGSSALTLTNLCQAYTAFARDGSYVKPRLVLSVTSAWGETLYKSEPEYVEAVSPQNAFLMASMLKEVINVGTGGAAKVLGRPLAGKTGTTNNEQDAWFIGFTPHLLTGVYVGYDQLQSMGREGSGGRTALPIWLEYRRAVEDRYPPDDFLPPEGIVWARVENSQAIGSKGQPAPESYFLPFVEGTQPEQTDVGAAETGDSTASDADLMKLGF